MQSMLSSRSLKYAIEYEMRSQTGSMNIYMATVCDLLNLCMLIECDICVIRSQKYSL